MCIGESRKGLWGKRSIALAVELGLGFMVQESESGNGEFHGFSDKPGKDWFLNNLWLVLWEPIESSKSTVSKSHGTYQFVLGVTKADENLVWTRSGFFLSRLLSMQSSTAQLIIARAQLKRVSFGLFLPFRPILRISQPTLPTMHHNSQIIIHDLTVEENINDEVEFLLSRLSKSSSRQKRIAMPVVWCKPSSMEWQQSKSMIFEVIRYLVFWYHSYWDDSVWVYIWTRNHPRHKFWSLSKEPDVLRKWFAKIIRCPTSEFRQCTSNRSLVEMISFLRDGFNRNHLLKPKSTWMMNLGILFIYNFRSSGFVNWYK